MRGRILAAALCLTGLLSFAAYGDQWVEIEDGVWEYRLDDGTYLTDGFTPDGYFIDGSGRWTENAVVLETEVPNRNSFLPPTDENAFLDYADILNDVQRVLYRDLGDIRRFRISDDRISFCAADGDELTELFTLYQNRNGGNYQLVLKTGLTRDAGEKPSVSWYDYECLRLLLRRISRTGDQLAEAVYYSWEGDNRYGIKMYQKTAVGDALGSYEPSGGAGIYWIEERNLQAS